MILTDFGGLGFRGVFGGSWEEGYMGRVEGWAWVYRRPIGRYYGFTLKPGQPQIASRADHHQLTKNHNFR